MSASHRRELVLALYPNSRGIAYASFAGALWPRDWGLKRVRSKQRNAAGLKIVQTLIKELQPDAVVLPAGHDPVSRRCMRVRALQRRIAKAAESQAIEVCFVSRTQIRECFVPFGAKTRYEIALAIAARIESFAARVPRRRDLWTAEDDRMGIFDAAALAMTHFGAGRRSFGSPSEV